MHTFGHNKKKLPMRKKNENNNNRHELNEREKKTQISGIHLHTQTERAHITNRTGKLHIGIHVQFHYISYQHTNDDDSLCVYIHTFAIAYIRGCAKKRVKYKASKKVKQKKRTNTHHHGDNDNEVE